MVLADNKKNHVLYTGGTFDLLHAGHVNFLKQCKSIVGMDGKVVVVVNTDEFIYEYKKQYPVMNFEERKNVLLGCKYVDAVIPNIGGSDSKQSIMQVNPTIIAIGSDWIRKDYYKQMSFTQDWLDKLNIMLLYIPYTDNISTTDIKKRLTQSMS